MAPEAVARITESLFAQVAQRAAASPRRRKNHNLHQESDLVQRFLNVLQPGTYVRPHRHRREQAGAGFECFVVLQGSVGLLVLNSAGEVLQRERLWRSLFNGEHGDETGPAPEQSKSPHTSAPSA